MAQGILDRKEPCGCLGYTTHHGNPQPSFLGVISYKPYIGGLKPSFFMVLGSKGSYIGILITIVRIPINQPVFHGKVFEVLFSWLKRPFVGW